jgi:CRP-like cAMP-binding protein
MKPFLHQDQFDVGPYFASCKTTLYEPGELICDIFDTQETVFLLRGGMVRVSILSAQGAERLLFYGHSGCIIGDTMCFGQQSDVPQGVRAVAVTSCEVAQMSQREFRTHCLSHPELTWALLGRAYCKVASLIEQLEYAAFRDTTYQVAALIHAFWLEIRRGKPSHDTEQLLNVTHQMIAAATGKTRVSVTYALNRLRSQGAIELHRGRIEVVDESVLARYADEPPPESETSLVAKHRGGAFEAGPRQVA